MISGVANRNLSNIMAISNNNKIPLLLMVLLVFSSQAGTDIFLSGLPMMAHDLNTTIHTMGLSISVYGYSQAFFVLFIGVISDLIGRRPTIIVCLALHIMALACIAVSDLLSVVIVMRVIQALGGAAVYIVFRLIMKDTMKKKEQIHAVGLLVLGVILSPLLAPSVGAAIIHYFNWRACFWAIVIFEVPLFIWVLKAINETNHEQEKIRASFSIKKYFLNYCAVLKNGYFLSLTLIAGATFAAFSNFMSISRDLYIHEYSIKSASYSYTFDMFTGIALSYLLGNRLMSILNSYNVSPKRIISIGLYASLFGAVIIFAELFFKDRVVVLALITCGICILRLATAIINPPIQVMITNHFEEKGAYALGLLTSIKYIFITFGGSFVSELPFQPTDNFMISTVTFIILSFIGYTAYSRNRRNLHAKTNTNKDLDEND